MSRRSRILNRSSEIISKDGKFVTIYWAIRTVVFFEITIAVRNFDKFRKNKFRAVTVHKLDYIYQLDIKNGNTYMFHLYL